MTANIIEKGSVRNLRHQIVATLDGSDLAEQVQGVLAGRAGMTFEEQLANVAQAKALINEQGVATDLADDVLIQATTLCDQIAAIVIARRDEANKPPSKADLLLTAQVLLATAQDALASASLRVEELTVAITGLTEAMTDLDAEDAPETPQEPKSDDLF